MSAIQIEENMSTELTAFKVYGIVHVASIFWLPFMIIVISYSVMMQQVRYTLLQPLTH
jgi:hypothetical protein